jgi:hypothetical protein
VNFNWLLRSESWRFSSDFLVESCNARCAIQVRLEHDDLMESWWWFELSNDMEIDAEKAEECRKAAGKRSR